MKASALAISLILILVPLAGCAGSDGEVNIDLTTEEIQELIDDNIDDFLNNTTVTVNQQNQNNNTTNQTMVNNYYNTTTIQQPSSLKAKSGTMTGVEKMDNYPVGVAILVRSDAYSINTNLNGANICVGVGTALEGELQQWFNSNEISFTTVGTPDGTESVEKMKAGTCDAVPFDSMQLAESVRGQLEQDSDWAATDTHSDLWIEELYAGGSTSPGYVESLASIQIQQSSDEMISGLLYLHLQVGLIGNCAENSTGCENFTTIFYPNNMDLVTTCSHGVSFSWETEIHSEWFEIAGVPFQGHGLNCTHSLNFEASQYTSNIPEYDASHHNLSWGDWVYSIIWESIPIEQEN